MSSSVLQTDAEPQDEMLSQQQGQQDAQQQGRSEKKAKPLWRGADHTTRKAQSDPKKRIKGDYVTYVDPYDGRVYDVTVSLTRFNELTQQMEYRLRTLGGFEFNRGGEWVGGEVLRDPRPRPLQQQAAPQYGSGSGPRPRRDDEPETGTGTGTGGKKASSLKRAANVASRLMCMPWSSRS